MVVVAIILQSALSLTPPPNKSTQTKEAKIFFSVRMNLTLGPVAISTNSDFFIIFVNRLKQRWAETSYKYWQWLWDQPLVNPE